jgi:eukaryotic-like serine/threonine-protein kinase
VSANVETSGFGGRELAGRWVVGDQLGSGTFGVVHAGVERATGQPVAVKLLHPQFLHHGETIARFWNEAEALRRLNHPNVLTLLGVGVTDDGVPYLVTELLTGETLRDLLNREGALPAERAMRLLGPAAHALHHAHLAGIVHRDLKPENIFRVRKDGMGTTKILDFGVAKLLDTSPGRKLSQTGIMLGTMAYSPPEQMQGLGDIDHRADQFGFAALMFEALTGQRPFPQPQPFALFQAVMSGERPRPSVIRPELPRAVDAVLLRALDPDRDKRYANIEQFYLAISSALTTPNFQSASTTFNGTKPVPLPDVSSAPQYMPPIVRPPAQEDRSVRFRAVDEEQTRGVAAVDSPAAPTTARDVHRAFSTTVGTGEIPKSSPPPANGGIVQLGTTLVEGRSPALIAEAMRSSPLPPSASPQSAPPQSIERAIRPPSERPAPLASERPIARASERAVKASERPSLQASDRPTTRLDAPAKRALPIALLAAAALLIVIVVALLLLVRHP